MSLTVDGVWKAGVWATTLWADGVWREGSAAPDVVTPQFSGGFDYPLDSRGRRQKDIPPKVEALILAVAERQAAQPSGDAQQHFEELERELTLQAVTWNNRYLEALNEQRAILRRRAAESMILLIAASI